MVGDKVDERGSCCGEVVREGAVRMGRNVRKGDA